MVLKDQMTAWLEGCGRIAILGIGNPLRGDDFIGMETIRLLRGKMPKTVKLFECETVPENFISDIETFSPTHVLMIDAAQLEAEPGEARLIPPEKINGAALSTHTLPLSLLAEVIRKGVNAKIMLLGIQPEKLEFQEGLSPKLQEASRKIADIIMKAVKSTC